MAAKSRPSQEQGMSAISAAILGVLHAPDRDALGVGARARANESSRCEGAADLCGAPAGRPCEPWCPSQAADPE